MNKYILIVGLLLSVSVFGKCIEVSDHALGDGSIETAQIQQAIDKAGAFGCVNFNLDLKFDGTLEVPAAQTWNGNVDWVSTQNPGRLDILPRLMYVGRSAMAIAASNFWLNGMIIQGNSSVKSALSTAIGVNIDGGNLRMSHSTLRGFKTLLKVRRSYYNLIEASTLLHANVIYDGGAVNNLTFQNCKMDRFDIGVKSTGGVGGINFIGGSIEQFTHRIVTRTKGSRVAVNLNGVYIENYPNTPIAAGLTKSTPEGVYYSKLAFTTGAPLTITGSTIIMRGIGRLIYETGSNVMLTGNRIIIDEDTPYKTTHIVYAAKDPIMVTQRDSIEFMKGGKFVPYDNSFTVNQFSPRVFNSNYDYLAFDGIWKQSSSQ